ncbi:cell division cycle 5 [Olea europaea subsp. europaea]|uniref:Cell division cycle 5 n=1 Tax=Olea europaea subsp. europaea TaxID=158383 RepID=A0A8S0THR7_OLEEU|nr:cell division cycle 5 [Olea europaea subsp. europaea]
MLRHFLIHSNSQFLDYSKYSFATGDRPEGVIIGKGGRFGGERGLEQNLQKRHGDLLEEKVRVQNLIDAYRIQAKMQEEIATKNPALEMAEAEAAVNQTVTLNLETNKTLAVPEDRNSVLVDTRPDGIPSQQMDAVQENGVNILTVEESTTSHTYSSIQTVPYPSQEVSKTDELPVKHNQITVEDTTNEGQENGMNVVTVTEPQVVQETAGDVSGNVDVF